MNKMQLYLSIGIPTLTVILAWVSNRADASRLNDKIDRQGESLRAKVGTLRNELCAELTAIRVDHHKDNMALMGYMVPLHERMAKLEERN